MKVLYNLYWTSVYIHKLLILTSIRVNINGGNSFSQNDLSFFRFGYKIPSSVQFHCQQLLNYGIFEHSSLIASLQNEIE